MTLECIEHGIQLLRDIRILCEIGKVNAELLELEHQCGVDERIVVGRGEAKRRARVRALKLDGYEDNGTAPGVSSDLVGPGHSPKHAR